MQRQVGVAPSNAADTATKAYVDSAVAVSALTYATSVTPNAATSRNFSIAATGSFTLNAPTNPTNGQMIMVEVRASAAVTVTIAAAILLTTGLTASLAVASGKSGFIGVRYSTAAAAWYLLASTSGV